MSIMVTTQRELFKFTELDEEAQDNARLWYREGEVEYQYSEEVVDDTIICNEYDFDEKGNIA